MIRRNGLLSVVALLLAGAVVGTMVAACGIRPSTVITGREAPRGAVVSLTVYLLKNDALRPTSRALPPPTTYPSDLTAKPFYVNPHDDALHALADGPTTTDAAGGLTSDVPVGTRMSSTYDDAYGNVVFAEPPDKQPLSQHALDQIVCTLATSYAGDGNTSSTTMKVTVIVYGRPQPKQSCPFAIP
ncbi:hypothetical protein [Kutzneria buriramensis]|uniref:GerMN domain-containing protein n=1 Tax=Kutzneria buriramensis TaxID=1045776 RepID=A0A3E0ICN0_9PSEU|nr:hypothetical protein [Kutzneria buriramensis]REH55935.1 hypothetical protein BCF44_101963 [Kutzneria buriramensis]